MFVFLSRLWERAFARAWAKQVSKSEDRGDYFAAEESMRFATRAFKALADMPTREPSHLAERALVAMATGKSARAAGVLDLSADAFLLAKMAKEREAEVLRARGRTSEAEKATREVSFLAMEAAISMALAFREEEGRSLMREIKTTEYRSIAKAALDAASGLPWGESLSEEANDWLKKRRGFEELTGSCVPASPVVHGGENGAAKDGL